MLKVMIFNPAFTSENRYQSASEKQTLTLIYRIIEKYGSLCFGGSSKIIYLLCAKKKHVFTKMS